MSESGTILALDLATGYGWAERSLEARPIAGSGRFAPAGSGHGAVGAEALAWFADRLAVTKPRAVFIERPGLHSVAQGKSSFDVIYRLLGLCFLAQAVAYRRGVYDVRFAKAEDVRLHFLGTKSLKGDVGKRRTAERCRSLGWEFRNDDESDALALLDYGLDQIFPGSGNPGLPGMFPAEPKAPRKPALPGMFPAEPKAPRKPAQERIPAAKARDLFKRRGR